MEKQQIVILIGPPGAGKDTQADLLAEDFGFYHFQTSRIIEQKFKDADQNDPVIHKEKELFTSGKLNSPEFVEGLILEKVQAEASQGRSIVFSGSPRTVAEAQAEIPIFERLYKKENIQIIHIEISEEDSLKRNTTRRICKLNRHPIPNFPEFENLTTCPKDGSEIETRILDNPEVIKVRYATYVKETKPVFDVFTQHGYSIIKVNGVQSIRKVHTDILTAIDQLGHTQLLEKYGE